MKPKKICFGTSEAENLFCAPLAGYTDFAFRKLCYSFGAGMCFTEMVSAKGLRYNNEATKLLLYTHPSEKNTAVQIFGSDPSIMRAACESEDLAKFSVVDINMGCPVPKVVKNGEGSALLNDLSLASLIISECKKSGKTVTVKFRIGFTEERKIAAEFARMCEDSGADLITVHGRTRDKIYSGEPDYGEIAAAKNAVSIPVIANGGIFTQEEADRMLENTGADGIMVARAAMFNPHVFTEITGGDKNWDIFAAVRTQISDMLPVYGEKYTVVQMRKMVAFYIKGMRDCAKFRNALFGANTLAELEKVCKEIFVH